MFVERDESGLIVGLYSLPQEGIPLEELPEDAAEVASFRNPPKSLAQRLDEIFQALPAVARAQFYTLKAAVKIAFESSDYEAAKLIIQNTAVPPELEAIKQQLLGEF